jgi:hypothetical protein
MGRQVRRVPPNWEHPRGVGGTGFRPLMAGPFSERLSEWDEEAAQWERGLMRSYREGLAWESKGDRDYTYAEYAGERPVATDYMPEWPEDVATHLMMYEDTSEGTPISPPFATPEQLAHWLTDNGASAFGVSTATYEQWLSACRRGWSVSMVIDGGVIRSGVAAMSEP